MHISSVGAYPRLSPSEREAAIKADVDRDWRIMQPETVQLLLARHASSAAQKAT